MPCVIGAESVGRWFVRKNQAEQREKRGISREREEREREKGDGRKRSKGTNIQRPQQRGNSAVVVPRYLAGSKIAIAPRAPACCCFLSSAAAAPAAPAAVAAAAAAVGFPPRRRRRRRLLVVVFGVVSTFIARHGHRGCSSAIVALSFVRMVRTYRDYVVVAIDVVDTAKSSPPRADPPPYR
jgi:hypothetical protein